MPEMALPSQAMLPAVYIVCDKRHGTLYTGVTSDLARRIWDHRTGALAGFTRRYGGWLSNSVRVIHNFGQDPDPGQPQTADGTLLLLENSLITRLPLTLVPYLNLFVGLDRPQSVARDAGAG